MAQVIVTFKIMPSSPEVDLGALEDQVKEAIVASGGLIAKVEQEPVAFGLTAVKIIFGVDEAKGSTDALEEHIAGFDHVASCVVVDVRRAFG